MTKVSISIDEDINIIKELNGKVTKIVIETTEDTYELISNNRKKLTKEDLKAIYDNLD